LDVAEALRSRFTCRAFLPTDVSRLTVEDILTQASRAPSGGNLQPWRVWALAGSALESLRAVVRAKCQSGRYGDGDFEYLVYPPDLKEPYATRRFRNGQAMYEAIGVTRENQAGRLDEYFQNLEFFGAPVGMFVFIDRTMQQGQWSDVGMFLQSVMLLAREKGLQSAALESWSLWHQTVRSHLGVPDELILFCGLALGHPDMANPINSIRSERAPLFEFATLEGFSSAT
jgi:nitroreductase